MSENPRPVAILLDELKQRITRDIEARVQDQTILVLNERLERVEHDRRDVQD